MISLAQIETIARVAGVAVPLIIEGFKVAKCAFEGCDVELEPIDEPDLERRAREQHGDMARIAAGLDRASIRARLHDDDELEGRRGG